MIRNLREENDKLKKILISAASDGGVINQEMLKDIQETFSGNQKAMEEMSIPFETRLIQAKQQAILEKEPERDTTVPHLTNLNEDPQFAGKVYYNL